MYLWSVRDEEYKRTMLSKDSGMSYTMTSVWHNVLVMTEYDVLDWFMKHKLWKPNEHASEAGNY